MIVVVVRTLKKRKGVELNPIWRIMYHFSQKKDSNTFIILELLKP